MAYLLIVDDDPDVTQKLILYFQAQNYTVKGASWREENFNFAEQTVPDIIMLGVVNATFQHCCQVFQALRTNIVTRRAAVIFLSDEHDRFSKITALELGVDEYVVKPFDVEELKLRVRNKLDFAQRQRPDGKQIDNKSKLLVVEDDFDIQKMMRIYFESQGYAVHTESRGYDGVAAAREIIPDLVILDIMLPDIDGYEVFKTLRSEAATRHIPVIFLTQKDAHADMIAGLQLGADDYIPKPFDIEVLKFKVSSVISRQREIYSLAPDEQQDDPKASGINFQLEFREERLAALERMLSTYYRSLNRLEERAAGYGLNIPVELDNQIDYFKMKIKEAKAEIRQLNEDG